MLRPGALQVKAANGPRPTIGLALACWLRVPFFTLFGSGKRRVPHLLGYSTVDAEITKTALSQGVKGEVLSVDRSGRLSRPDGVNKKIVTYNKNRPDLPSGRERVRAVE